ncbi:uncharacterized protein K02A2.6-like [Pecten maximus]|uniref:uncharacterized protein K02A2.6-like n=1 Tax=Pecten maximus TaxID=6579 RepID=UPI0014585EE8|nr:uncharacterized protein K02A2.6-like [Pecten maximus]
MKKPLFAAPARLQRLMLRLQKYTLSVTYRPGSTMYIADQLSRAYLKTSKGSDCITEELEAQVHMVLNSLPVSAEKLSEIKLATKEDSEMRTIMEMVKDGWPEERSALPLNIRTYWPYRDEIIVSDGVLFKGGKLIIPNPMRKEMVQRVHSSHMGIEKSRARARDILFWPGMSSDIEEHVSSCPTCNQFRNSTPREPLQPHDIPERPWQKIGLDLFQHQDNTYLLAIDYYSKFVELFLLKNDTRSQTVITHLKSLFARQGIPDEVMTDNGPQFSSDVFKVFSKKWDLKHTTSSPRYPRSNGMVERGVQTAKNLLKKAQQDGRDPYLALLEYLNTPVNEKGSPAQLLMSRRLKTPIPVSAQLLKPEVLTDVRECLTDRQRKQKFYYDRGTKLAETLSKGQRVRVQSDDKKEWHSAKVVEKDPGSSRSYKVKRKDGSIIRRNRSHIIPVREKVVQENLENLESCVSPDSDTIDLKCEEGETKENVLTSPAAVGSTNSNAYVTRSGRQSKTPSRLDDYEVYWCYSL